jgi:thymidylate synthase
MIVFDGATADAAWRKAMAHLRQVAPIQAGRDQPTRELLHAAFDLQDPRQRVVFARPINPAFALAEVLWILAGANSVEFLRFWNPRMNRYSDDNVCFHGAYGYRLGHQPHLDPAIVVELFPRGRPHIDQLQTAYHALTTTPESRQVVLQIWDAELDLPNPNPRSKDIPCNIISHLLVRDDKLEWLQVMRSNDLVWGTPYNFIQWTTVQEIMAGWLGVDVGTYTHISDSLHVYQRHWADLDAFPADAASAVPANRADLRLPYAEWEQTWNALLDGAIRLTKASSRQAIHAAAERFADVPAAYRQWGSVLTAEALRRQGHQDEAVAAIATAGDFWQTSWMQWDASHHQPAAGAP